MLEARHCSATGGARDAGFALPSDYFDGTVNTAVLHQAIKTFLGNQRQGTASTKTRSHISGGNQKPWKQKGTGRARQGTTRAPHWRGGGVVFGPHPRDYRTGLPKKVRQLARKSALNARAREGALIVIDRLSFESPKTSAFAAILEQVGLTGQKVLVLTHGQNPNAWLSARNIPGIRIMPWSDAAPYDIIWSSWVLVEAGALTGGEAIEGADGGEESTAPAPARRKSSAPKASAGKTASATKPKAKAKVGAKAPARKTAVKKGPAKKTTTKATSRKSSETPKGGK